MLYWPKWQLIFQLENQNHPEKLWPTISYPIIKNVGFVHVHCHAPRPNAYNVKQRKEVLSYKTAYIYLDRK